MTPVTDAQTPLESWNGEPGRRLDIGWRH